MDGMAPLTVTARSAGAATVLTPHGLLDSTTYRSLRDRVIKAALEEPVAVLVDVAGLRVPAESAWVVFTSARWHVRRWPDVPILLVCEHPGGRETITRIGVARYVPVYPAVDAALDAMTRCQLRYRRRTRASLAADPSSLRTSRTMVEQSLAAWSMAELIPVAKVVVTSLVENVLEHTASTPGLRIETDGGRLTVAVEDTSPVPATVRDQPTGTMPSGLRIIAALCCSWGNVPTPSGKTVWAMIGPENRL
jgi:hypothetical protein